MRRKIISVPDKQIHLQVKSRPFSLSEALVYSERSMLSLSGETEGHISTGIIAYLKSVDKKIYSLLRKLEDHSHENEAFSNLMNQIVMFIQSMMIKNKMEKIITFRQHLVTDLFAMGNDIIKFLHESRGQISVQYQQAVVNLFLGGLVKQNLGKMDKEIDRRLNRVLIETVGFLYEKMYQPESQFDAGYKLDEFRGSRRLRHLDLIYTIQQAPESYLNNPAFNIVVGTVRLLMEAMPGMGALSQGALKKFADEMTKTPEHARLLRLVEDYTRLKFEQSPLILLKNAKHVKLSELHDVIVEFNEAFADFLTVCKNACLKYLETENANVIVHVTEAAVEPKIDHVLFLGDSLTAGFGVEKSFAFPAYLQCQLRVPVASLGKSGIDTGTYLRHLRELVRQDNKDSFRNSLVVVELGINDFNRYEKVSDVKKNLTEMVRLLQDKAAKVAVAGFSLQPVKDTTAWENMYREVSEETSALLVPDIMKGIINKAAYNQPDGHPNGLGHVFLAANVLEALTPYLRENGLLR